MNDAKDRQDEHPPSPAAFAYGVASRLWAATITVVACVPLLYVLVFLVRNPPGAADVGPILLVLVFLLVPPVFAWLRFGDAFRRFEVRPYQLVAQQPLRSWTLRWRDVSRVVRRSRGRGGQSFRVSVQVQSGDGKSTWIALFDSSLPRADELYAQIVAHTPHIRPKELVDEPGWLDRRR